MKTLLILIGITIFSLPGCTQQKLNTTDMKNNASDMKFNALTPEEEAVILNKATERPFTGKYNSFTEKGTYTCKRCNAPLYKSDDKFKSDCGWPSFDDEIAGAVKRVPDADGRRVEIVCNSCGGHLGHVFEGERFTSKNTRHCVNSVSLNFIPAGTQIAQTDTAIFAGGCFWGVEYYMQEAPGVISTKVGYIGGRGTNPTYQEVCSHTTGFAEAVEVVFDPQKTSYEAVAKLFFEIHDPTQLDRQGPDVGDQYRSAVFYKNEGQKAIVENLVEILKSKGLKVVTEIVPAAKFWNAEEYHQQYYAHKNGTPYCHKYVKRF